MQTIEIKSSNGGIATWNGNYPKENGIYIYYDSKLNQITYFMGKTFINKSIKYLINICEQSIDIVIMFFNKYFEENGIMWKKVHYRKTEHSNKIKRYISDNKNEERMREVEDYIIKLY